MRITGKIRQDWSNHFQHLATPQENPKFDRDYKQLVDGDIVVI